MRDRLSLFGFIFLLFFNSSYAQNKTLTDAIDEVRSQGVQIIYSNQYLNTDNYSLTNNLKQITLIDLKTYLKTIGFELVSIKPNIFIIKVLKTSKIVDSGILVLSIYDRNSHLKLINAKAKIVAQPHLKSYEADGIVSFINLPKDHYTIIISAENYVPITLTIDLLNQSIVTQDVLMLRLPKKLERITVTTSQYDFKVEKNTNSHSLSNQELITTPHIGNDPVRAISKLPGLTGNGISARSYVRGGKQSESGVILNGLELNDPYHFDDFFGIFSIIDLSYTQDVALYAGVFPSKFGNRISSMMEVTSIQPERPLFIDSSINVFNAHLTMGGKLSENSQYVASFRSGGEFFDTNVLSVDVGDPKYDDGFVSVSHDYKNGIELQASLLFSNDNIAVNVVNEVAESSNQSRNLWLNLKNVKFNNVTINNQVHSQRSTSERSGTLNNNLVTGTLFKSVDTKSYGISSDATVTIDQNTSISLGLDWNQLENHSLYNLSKSSFNFITTLLNQEEMIKRNYQLNQKGQSFSFFTNFRHQFNPSLVSDIGIRYDQQSWIKKKQISPRLNVSYFYDDTTTFRMGIGRQQQTQFIDELLFEDNNLTYFEPEIADIAIFEVTKQLNSDWTVRAEAYYKNYENVLPYYENLFVPLRLNPELFEDRVRITPESAHAKGIDITLSKKYNNFSWSAGYSFSNIEDIFANEIQKRSWDQKNGFKFNSNWQLKKWSISTLLTYHSGWPRTIITDNSGDLLIQGRNADRYRDYINLDLRTEYHFSIKKTDSIMWFQLSNAFDRDNQCCTEYSYEINANNQLELINKNKKWFPILPSIGINFYFD